MQNVKLSRYVDLGFLDAYENGLLWRPVLARVQKGEIALVQIMQTTQSFADAVKEKEDNVLFYFGDDFLSSKGPDHFDRKSVEKVLAKIKCATVVSGNPNLVELNPYDKMALAAAHCIPALIVDTRAEHELQWHALISKYTDNIIWLTHPTQAN